MPMMVPVRENTLLNMNRNSPPCKVACSARHATKALKSLPGVRWGQASQSPQTPRQAQPPITTPRPPRQPCGPFTHGDTRRLRTWMVMLNMAAAWKRWYSTSPASSLPITVEFSKSSPTLKFRRDGKLMMDLVMLRTRWNAAAPAAKSSAIKDRLWS
jgi:hypothetical protein